MLGLAATVQGDTKGLCNKIIDLIDSGVLSLVLFNASVKFDAAIATQGEDIKNMMRGFGSKGLTRTFGHMTKLAKTVFMAVFVSQLVSRISF